MSNRREEILRKHTHKESELPTDVRVFATLDIDDMEKQSPTVARTMRLLGSLIGELEHRGYLTPENVDDLLLDSLPDGLFDR